MIELSQDDLDALARCFRLLAARGRQLRQARGVERSPSTAEAAIRTEAVELPCAQHDNGDERWKLTNG